MLRARLPINAGSNEAHIIIGLSQVDIALLISGKSLPVGTKDLGIENLSISLMCRKTDETMAKVIEEVTKEVLGEEVSMPITDKRTPEEMRAIFNMTNGNSNRSRKRKRK